MCLAVLVVHFEPAALRYCRDLSSSPIIFNILQIFALQLSLSHTLGIETTGSASIFPCTFECLDLKIVFILVLKT